jgi:hypothetical protein
MAETNPALPNPPGVDYDRHEAKSGLIAIISVSIIGLLVVLICGVYYLYMVSYERVEENLVTGVPSQELKAIHDREEQHLHQYSYIDKEKDIVRVPIDKAMDLLVLESADGKTPYNTMTYPVKVELPGGAAGGANAPAPGSAPDGTAQPAGAAQPATQNPPAANTTNAPAAR